MFNLLKIFSSNSNESEIAELQKSVDEINAVESHYASLEDEALSSQTDLLVEKYENSQSLDEILIDAFAVVRETSKRILEMRHFDVQLMGGVSLHQGKISEMRTGEGKTLIATLAVYLNSLSKKGVHVVTVNDYLAKRDALWMGKIYKFLVLTVGCIKNVASINLEYETDDSMVDGISYNRMNITGEEEAITEITISIKKEMGIVEKENGIPYPNITLVILTVVMSIMLRKRND